MASPSGRVRRASAYPTWSAAIGILGFVNVPIVYMSVRWWRTIHQVQSNTESMDPLYVKFLLLNLGEFTLIALWMIVKRYHVATLEREAEAKLEDRAFARRSTLVNAPSLPVAQSPSLITPEVANVG